MKSRVICVICLFASVIAQCPTIISRKQWGARPPESTPKSMKTPVPYVVIHHGASAPCSNQKECTARVRSYQKLHMDTNGWNDIGYSFVVGEDGNVYEARGWSSKGAHAPKYNSNSTGICVIGNFQDRVPNDDALSAIQSLIKCGIKMGKIKKDYKLIGHRQASSTACPGNRLYDVIKKWPHWTAKPE